MDPKNGSQISSNDHFTTLISSGFSDKEAKTYLAVLKLEIATANEIAECAGINRSSAYVILETLKKKGLVATAEGSSVQSFFATTPNTLVHAAEQSVKAAQEKLERIKTAIPDLRAMYKDTPHLPKVRVYEGVSGLIEGMAETLESTEKFIRTFTSGEKILSLIPEYMVEWSKILLERKINARGIYVDSEATRAMVYLSKGVGKSVFVSKDKFPFPVDVLIWDSKVGYLVIDGDNITTIIIEGVEIGIVMKSIFDMAFEQAKTMGKFENT